MPLRFYIDEPLHEAAELKLPPGAARHAQVLRLQPQAAITLFDGRGGEWQASIVRMGRSEVAVRVGRHLAVERELPLHVTLALGMPANERMDTLIEKATELGVAVVQPLHCERSVLRLAGERAAKKVAHWRAVAQAACEQSGRTRVPLVAPVCSLHEWLAALPAPPAAGPAGPAPAGQRLLLSPGAAQPLAQCVAAAAVVCVSGPEGGLTDAEEEAALDRGFGAVHLGARVLRADTAPLAVLAHLGLRFNEGRA
jgi:16S rRNA (uracil1498-N3)-methyltransferase